MGSDRWRRSWSGFVIMGPPNMYLVFVYGAAWGLGNGFYWANRNYLEFQETLSEMRQYFYGLLSSIASIANVVVPFLAGWFIVLGGRLHLYTPRHAYWIVFGFSFLLLFISGTIIRHGTFSSPKPGRISRLGFGSFWKPRRILSIASGFTDGAASFTPVLLVLLLLGNEGVLGSITAVVSLATAIAMYSYGRYVQVKYEYRTVLASSILFLVSALCLVLFPGKIGVILHVILIGVSSSFYAMAVSPILLSLGEEEMAGNPEERYSLVFDTEFFLNAGRLTGIAVVLLVAYFTSQMTALVYGSILVGIIHLTLVAVFLAVPKYKQENF